MPLFYFFYLSKTAEYIGLTLTFFILVFWLCLSGQSIASQQSDPTQEKFVGDFLEYWGSARLLLAGKNPYSPEQLLEVQRSVVGNKKGLTIMWNPPWTLFFLIPFGLLSFSTGQLLWLMLNAASLLVCSAHLWRIYGGPPGRYRIAWLICFSVVPTYGILYMMQITPLVLAGIVGFLHFQERKQWWLAGTVLVLIAIKPHLAYIFWLALLLWVLEKRQWRVILGGVISGMIITIIPLLFVSDLFGYYFQAYLADTALTPFNWATPTLSNALLLLFGLDNVWVRLVLPIGSLVWFLLYWRKQRNNWIWTEQMPLILLLSQATTVFAWTYDQILLLPALMQVAIWSTSGGPRKIISVAFIAFLLINLPTLLVLNGVLIPNGFWLFWMVPVFLLAYSMFHIQITTAIRARS